MFAHSVLRLWIANRWNEAKNRSSFPQVRFEVTRSQSIQDIDFYMEQQFFISAAILRHHLFTYASCLKLLSMISMCECVKSFFKVVLIIYGTLSKLYKCKNVDFKYQNRSGKSFPYT